MELEAPAAAPNFDSSPTTPTRADGRTDDVRTDATDREHSRVVARTRKTVVGAFRLVTSAAPRRRVRHAGDGAERRGIARRGSPRRAETFDTSSPGTAPPRLIARSAQVSGAFRRGGARGGGLRTDAAPRGRVEEARAQAETKAEVYRVELASLRAIEAERAEAEAEARAETRRDRLWSRSRLQGPRRRSRGGSSSEKALAEASASASVAAATPEARGGDGRGDGRRGRRRRG